MKKHATYLIQHIEKIYTMSYGDEAILHHGFLALYHDHIIAMGMGDGAQYIDKDTRIIEGRGHIAIPGFCDINMHFPTTYHYPQDKARNLLEHITVLLKHGTLVANIQAPWTKKEEKLLALFAYQPTLSFYQKDTSSLPTISLFEAKTIDIQKPFALSCGYPTTQCLDQMLCAKWFYKTHTVDAQKVLAACTIHPATALALPNVGSLQVGNIANILLLEGETIEAVFNRFNGDERMHIIKEGVRVFPNILT